MIAGKQEIARYFEDLLDKYGDHHLSLDWKSKESQLLRFTALLDILAFLPKKDSFSILDVGCGIGDLYGTMKESGMIDKFKLSYKGIDISKKMVDFASKKFPEVSFKVVDLINDKYEEKFDLVFCSGVFNIRMADEPAHFDTVRKMLSRMYALSKSGVSVNFLARSSLYLLPDDRDPQDRYVLVPEEEVIQWVRAVSPRYILRKDYHPGDFTVYMLK
jgi:SAM-dependent methyltransferase